MASKKLEFNFDFLDIDQTPFHETIGFTKDGEEIKAATTKKANEFLGKSLFISSETADDYMKNYEWAIELRKSGVLNLDTSDAERLLKFIKDMKAPAFVKAQLAMVFKEKKSA